MDLLTDRAQEQNKLNEAATSKQWTQCTMSFENDFGISQMNEKQKGRQPGVKNYTVEDDNALLETVLRLKMNWALIIKDLHNNQHGEK